MRIKVIRKHINVDASRMTATCNEAVSRCWGTGGWHQAVSLVFPHLLCWCWTTTLFGRLKRKNSVYPGISARLTESKSPRARGQIHAALLTSWMSKTDSTLI